MTHRKSIIITIRFPNKISEQGLLNYFREDFSIRENEPMNKEDMDIDLFLIPKTEEDLEEATFIRKGIELEGDYKPNKK